MIDIHITGGPIFMVPLSILFLLNIAIIATVFVSSVLKKKPQPFWLEMIRQIGGLALVWGVFSTMIGLYFAFGDLSTMEETLPVYVIMGGLKVGLITSLYGLIICTVSLVAYLGLKILGKNLSNS
jgi:hypothetical protein